MMSLFREQKLLDGACYSTSCPVHCRALLLAARSGRMTPPFAIKPGGGALQRRLLTYG